MVLIRFYSMWLLSQLGTHVGPTCLGVHVTPLFPLFSPFLLCPLSLSQLSAQAGQRVGTGEKAGGRRVCWRSATGDAAAVTAATTSSAAGRGGG